MLAKICEEQGRRAEAAAYYEGFLGLWKDADSGAAEVEEARERLSMLKGLK